MLTLEQFNLVQKHQDYFQRLLPLATELNDKKEAEKQTSKPITVDMIRKLAKRERDYSRVGFETSTAKEFLKLRDAFAKLLGEVPTLDSLEALFSESQLHDESKKFIFLEE
ncbi:hypothetical protein JCM19233_7298 [Vibrio astriarenae]|nr:hypothetical protein JCM19233_7298 [Vibrio sp. C7]